jgi:hypothetical protein
LRRSAAEDTNVWRGARCGARILPIFSYNASTNLSFFEFFSTKVLSAWLFELFSWRKYPFLGIFSRNQKNIESKMISSPKPLPIVDYRHLSLKYRITGRIGLTFMGRL